MPELEEHILAYDCLPFENKVATADVLQAFMESQSKNVFRFSTDYKQDEENKLAEFDYYNNQWNAGRFVGEAIFTHDRVAYKICIKPRFGEKFLFRMLEEIFNIRITASASQITKSVDWVHYIKRIIAFIWIQKVANANLHGLPKTLVKREHTGRAVRGRLDVRKSAIPLHRSNEVVSAFRERQTDDLIAQIIFKAYQILRADFDLGKINIPDSAVEALNQVSTVVVNKVPINESDYKNIKYKDIYLSWKPVVDLSWDIIKGKRSSNLNQEKAKSGYGFFIDMAEVWEQYLRSTLKKHLSRYGWRYIADRQIAYKGYFFQRELIPDLVFQKENDVAIWDAKYKRMKGRFFDVDRSDFFQIHTYIQYLHNHKTVKAGGLLYPISGVPDFNKYQSPYLMNEEGAKIKFSIDGIELVEKTDSSNHRQAETDFINRIVKAIS